MTLDRNSWGTPRHLFDEQNRIHNFTVDAAASDSNALLPRYWTKEINGLIQPWAGERIWVNPPYGKGLIEPWVDKALTGEADLVVLLLPVRTSTRWFQKLWASRNAVTIDFLEKRVRFVPPAGVTASSPTEDSLLAVIRGGSTLA